jgi:HIV Tat-specific factor 1
MAQSKKNSKKSRAESNEQQQRERKNTSIYVTNIPLDAEFDEIVEVFSKSGLIAESITDGQKRVKMYNDEEGKFKGDALITYFREESIPNAIMLFDDADFRLGVRNPAGPLKVQKADFSHKKEEADKPPPRQMNEIDKERMKKRAKKMHE